MLGHQPMHNSEYGKLSVLQEPVAASGSEQIGSARRLAKQH